MIHDDPLFRLLASAGKTSGGSNGVLTVDNDGITINAGDALVLDGPIGVEPAWDEASNKLSGMQTLDPGLYLLQLQTRIRRGSGDVSVDVSADKMLRYAGMYKSNEMLRADGTLKYNQLNTGVSIWQYLWIYGHPDVNYETTRPYSINGWGFYILDCQEATTLTFDRTNTSAGTNQCNAVILKLGVRGGTL